MPSTLQPNLQPNLQSNLQEALPPTLQCSTQYSTVFDVAVVDPALTLGELSRQIIFTQCDRIFHHAPDVLADADIEPLHQMRVGTRRLRTALQIFNLVVQLPKSAPIKLRKLANVLGTVRDLDVQISRLQEDYLPLLPKREQKQLDRLIAKLQKQRSQAFLSLQKWLKGDRYAAFKAIYEQWLMHPRYTTLGQIPLQLFLNQSQPAIPVAIDPTSLFYRLLLHPLISEFQAHQGWQGIDDALTAPQQLHDLRKACKQVRYQTEFFKDWYGNGQGSHAENHFPELMKSLKQLQDALGEWQDGQVLLGLLPQQTAKLSTLKQIIQTHQLEVLSHLYFVRQQFCIPLVFLRANAIRPYPAFVVGANGIRPVRNL